MVKKDCNFPTDRNDSFIRMSSFWHTWLLTNQKTMRIEKRRKKICLFEASEMCVLEHMCKLNTGFAATKRKSVTVSFQINDVNVVRS